MATFTFKLEQVRQYRKQLEEQAMQAMAQALLQRDALQARIEFLEFSIFEQRERLCRADSLDAAERWLIQSYETALKEDLEQSRIDLVGAEEYVDQCRTELVQKAKERGLLDSLKEKQAARHALQERQREQLINDETATLRYKFAAV